MTLPKSVEPRKERRFLKHYQPVPTWMKYRLIVRQDAALIGFFQAGNDIEQRGFAAPARADDAR